MKPRHTPQPLPAEVAADRRLPPLEAVRVFEAVARCGSTVAAAAELGLTHGAVSRRVRALEDHLGAALFGRGRGGRLVPTEAGEALARAARRAFGLLADAAAEAGGGARRRVVRVSTTASFAALWLLPRLPRFHARHPVSRSGSPKPRPWWSWAPRPGWTSRYGPDRAVGRERGRTR